MGDIINIVLDPHKLRINEKLHKNIFIHHIEYVMLKYLSHTKIDSVKLLYVIIDQMNGYIEESNRNKCFTLLFSDESKNILKKYEKLFNKIRGLFRSITSKSDNYDKKYMKIKLIWMIIYLYRKR